MTDGSPDRLETVIEQLALVSEQLTALRLTIADQAKVAEQQAAIAAQQAESIKQQAATAAQQAESIKQQAATATQQAESVTKLSTIVESLLARN
ncbi:MAG: hypothetical protein AAGF24_14100 [Cyanobacteria bacterium P01_H01_bin.121]